MDAFAQMFRMASFRIHQSLVDKPLTIEKFWPLWGDKKASSDKFVWGRTKEEAIEFYNQIKAIHNKHNLN